MSQAHEDAGFAALLDACATGRASAQTLAIALRPTQPPQPVEAMETLAMALAHPWFGPLLREGALPAPINDALEAAMAVYLPMVGQRAFGTLAQQAALLLRVYRAEAYKAQVVATRLADGPENDPPDEARAQLLSRYLQTQPSPMHVHALRQVFPALMTRARAIMADALPALSAGFAPLVEALRDPQPSAPALLEAARAASLPAPVTLRHALRAGDTDQALIAAALCGLARDDEATTAILERLWVAPGASIVPLAVIVQALAPQQARQAFALAMIEASAGNPEEIEVQRLAHNVALLTVMRGLLPGLGSELMPLDPDALPQAASGAAPLLRHALALREAWDQARAMWTTASP